MASVFTTRAETDLNTILHTVSITDGVLMTGDNTAHELIISVKNGFDEVRIPQNTKIVAYFIRSDSYTIEAGDENCSITENGEVRVVFPEAAYQIAGLLNVAVRLFDDPILVVDEESGIQYQTWNSKIVIASLQFFVQTAETNSRLDVYHHIPDVQELLAYIDALDQRRIAIDEAEDERALHFQNLIDDIDASEETRMLSEQERIAQEIDRVQAELLRAQNYAAKMLQYDQNESDRQSAFEQSQATRQSTFETTQQEKQQQFDQAQSSRQSTFNQNENNRQEEFDQNQADRQHNYNEFIDNIDSAEEIRVATEQQRIDDENTRQFNESVRETNEQIRISNETSRVAAEAARVTAQNERLTMIDDMEVEAVALNPYENPSANISLVNGHKKIVFGLVPGDPFVIAKTFTSVDVMNAYYPNSTDIELGQFVAIANNDMEDPDNAKLYVKTDSAFVFVTDLSGSQGIQGPRGFGIQSVSLDTQNYTLTLTFENGYQYTTPISIRGNGIANIQFNNDYTMTITDTDGGTYTSGNIRGNGIASIVFNNDYTMTITDTDGHSVTSESIRGNGIANIEYNTTDHKIHITDTDGNEYLTPVIKYVTSVSQTNDKRIKLEFTDGTNFQTDIINYISNVQETANNEILFTFTDGSTFTTSSLKGEPGAAGTRFTYSEPTSHLQIDYF